MKQIVILLIIVFVFIPGVSLTFAQSTPADSTHKYVGAGKCKLCHSADKIGAQFKIWEASKHARAFIDLSSDTAKAIAKARGIDDPQKDSRCLKCHETGYGQPAGIFETSFDPTQGVQCETCHGPASDYWKMSTMKDIHDKKIGGPQVGMILPTEEVCKKCHNQESPFYHGFDFKTYSEKIEHPIPAGN